MTNKPYLINSISEQHRLLSLPRPEHPLVSLIDFSDVIEHTDALSGNFMMNFYTIAIKKGFKGKLKYGQNYYDFDEGVMSFISPGQVLSKVTAEDIPLAGWMLMIHPDFIRHYTLAKTIKNYGFFSYDLNEALHLSEKEENLVAGIMKNIRQEYCSVIDPYSQDVIISHIELLLNYSNRFYNRQFITRKHINNDLLINLETLLAEYFTGDHVQRHGLPTVQYVAQALNLSPSYLSDMLRSFTGQNAQQHIHDKLIEKAKENLSATSLTVSEIAYQLGFEHPQSFSRFFKNKTNHSPLEYRSSFH